MRGGALLQASIVNGSLLFVGGAMLDIAHYRAPDVIRMRAKRCAVRRHAYVRRGGDKEQGHV
jgi:hypothetical protein